MRSQKSRHIYIHIPFCDVICHYCDFYTARNSTALHEEFFSALITEANEKIIEIDTPISAIYFGGGTPSTSPPELIHKFLDIFRSRLMPDSEITLEANPRNISEQSVRAWREAGINRLSMGIQSLDDSILKKLGRTHSAEQALTALKICLKEIPNVTGDLIYGVPGQGESDPARDALKMADIGVAHFSAYHLSIPPSHFLYRKLPQDSFAFEQIYHVHESLKAKGFRHYEISNFSKPGFESKNNLNYWQGGPYAALGPSAHGFDGHSKRWHNLPDWKAYVANLKNGLSVIHETEFLTAEQRKIEAIFTGLRLDTGVDLKEIEARFQCEIISSKKSLFEFWDSQGFGTLDNGIFRPTFKGRMLADELAQKLI